MTGVWVAAEAQSSSPLSSDQVIVFHDGAEIQNSAPSLFPPCYLNTFRRTSQLEPLDFEVPFGYTPCGLSFSLNSTFRHGALEQSERGRSFCAPRLTGCEFLTSPKFSRARRGIRRQSSFEFARAAAGSRVRASSAQLSAAPRRRMSAGSEGPYGLGAPWISFRRARHLFVGAFVGRGLTRLAVRGARRSSQVNSPFRFRAEGVRTLRAGRLPLRRAAWCTTTHTPDRDEGAHTLTLQRLARLSDIKSTSRHAARYDAAALNISPAHTHTPFRLFSNKKSNLMFGSRMPNRRALAGGFQP